MKKRSMKSAKFFIADQSTVERAIVSLEKTLAERAVAIESGLLKIIVNEYRMTRSKLEALEREFAAIEEADEDDSQ